MMELLSYISVTLGLQPCQVTEMWTKFVRYKAQKKEPVFKNESIKVKYESYGLAGELHIRCSRRTGRMRGHTTICHADTIQAQNHNKPDNKICAINLRAIIATQLTGCSHTDLKKRLL